MPDRSDSPWERLVDVLVRSEHSKADEQGTMLLTPVGVAVTLRDQVDLLTDLAIEAGWVPPTVATADLSHVQEIAARLDDFDD